jgi:hypothetical protein
MKKFGKKDFKYWNWEETGLLDGLDTLTYDTVKSYLKQINFDKICDDSITYMCIAPAVRKVILSIIDNDDQFAIFHNQIKDVEKGKILSLVNIDNIINELDDFCKVFLPISQKYLSNIDSEAEMIVLFCNNYVFGLINQVKIDKITTDALNEPLPDMTDIKIGNL